MDLRTAILTLIKSNTGIGADIFGILCIHKLEDNSFAVSFDGGLDILEYHKKSWEEIFEKAEDAVDYFLKKREELKYGYDFETETETENYN